MAKEPEDGAASKPNRNVTVDVRKLPIENPDNVRPVYANFAGVSQTPWDFQIMFSQMIVRGQTVGNELRGLVIMTPHHAKAFLKVLQGNIEEFERQHGEIKWQRESGKPEGQKSPHPQTH